MVVDEGGAEECDMTANIQHNQGLVSASIQRPISQESEE